MCSFKGEGKEVDDQVDASSGAFNKLADGAAYHAPSAMAWEPWQDPYAAAIGGDSW
jgi:hypothetical protein